MITLNRSSQLLLYSLTFAIATEIAYRVYKRNKTPPAKSKPKAINEVILFSNDQTKLKKSNYSRCMITPSFERLLHYLNRSVKSIDICMYVFTNIDIANELVRIKRKGVKIRLIIDADMAYVQGSQIRRMEKHNIPVRWMKSTNLMHHKFCIVDIDTSMPYIISGSLNWTTQALNGNWENVVVTSQSEIVNHYRITFETMWEKFKLPV